MAYLTHLSFPIGIRDVLRPDWLESLLFLGLLSDFDKFLAISGLQDSLNTLTMILPRQHSSEEDISLSILTRWYRNPAKIQSLVARLHRYRGCDAEQTTFS